MANHFTREPIAGVTLGNAFIESLDEPVRYALLRHASVVPLTVRDLIYDRGQRVDDVYFPIEGVISNVFQMLDGGQVETGIIGREGMAGVPAVLTGGTSVGTLYTQIAGAAWKIPASAVVSAACDVAGGLQPFLRYVDAEVSHFAQYGACNRLHTINRRFARWLLMAHDRVRGDGIPLTQEFLALMLGIRRPGVSFAASKLQKDGIISYRRGHIAVADRAALQAEACECYDSVEDRFEERMGYSIRKWRLDRPEQ